MVKKKRVFFIEHDVARSYDHGLELFKPNSTDIETEFVKRYFNSFHLYVKLSKAECVLLNFLTEIMDDENFVSNNDNTFRIFNNLLKKTGQKEYSKSTVNKSFSALSYHHAIFPIKGKRGIYQVNPWMFFKGSEEQRVKVVREYLERPNKEKINQHRHKLLSMKESFKSDI